MRWFWILIVLLAVVTAALFVRRTRSSSSPALKPSEPILIQPSGEPQESSTSPALVDRPDEHRNTQPNQAPAATESLIQTPAEIPAQPLAEIHNQSAAWDAPIDSSSEPAEPATPADHSDTEPDTNEEIVDHPSDDLDPGAKLAGMSEAVDESEPDLIDPSPNPEPTIEPQPESVTHVDPMLNEEQEPADSREPQEALQEAEITPKPGPEPAQERAPEYERLPDGSIRIMPLNKVIAGDGSADHPFLLSWDILASVEKEYEPRKGKTHLPAWLDVLNEKHVRIVGNTLVPVVASSTSELVMMQNPWDGCCIGVPPTPYDAIEVTLSHDVDFGNSAVGYGTLEGIFYLDPYVVDGWVLGLYIVEDGVYRSGEGVEFPEF